jgi:hypothetical protein
MNASQGVSMPTTASEILRDGFVQRYGMEDMFNVYYTCFPVDEKEKLYECLKGKFDACYSDNLFWKERSWKELAVPKLFPKRYHLPFMALKNELNILKIHEK